MVNQSNPGFSLIECLVYCALLSLISIMLFDGVGQYHHSLKTLYKSSSSMLDIYSAMDLFIQDAWQSPFDAQAWKKISEKELIWNLAHTDVGWQWENDSLYRITGRYNNQQWEQSTKSLVHPALKKVVFQLVQNGDQEVIQIKAAFDEHVRTISLRNRRLDYEVAA